MDSSWILPRWYMVSMAPSTPPRSLMASNSFVHGFFDDVGEGVDDVAALPGVFVEVEAEFFVDDHLDGYGAAHAFFRWRGDGFVVGVGVQAVAVVEQCVQRLQRVVRMSLNWISCACRERPDVWMWYFIIWLRALAP